MLFRASDREEICVSEGLTCPRSNNWKMAKPQMKLGSEPMLFLPPKQSVLEGVKFQPDNFLKDEHNNFEIIQGYNVHTDIVKKIFAETQILKNQFIPNLISNSDINRS